MKKKPLYTPYERIPYYCAFARTIIRNALVKARAHGADTSTDLAECVIEALMINRMCIVEISQIAKL